jgi:hypothetical protein
VWFALTALLVLIIEVVMLERKNPLLKNVRLFKDKKVKA